MRSPVRPAPKLNISMPPSRKRGPLRAVQKRVRSTSTVAAAVAAVAAVAMLLGTAAPFAFSTEVAHKVGCTDDMGCSLNGGCQTSSGTCVCDAPWTGNNCSVLSFNATPPGGGCSCIIELCNLECLLITRPSAPPRLLPLFVHPLTGVICRRKSATMRANRRNSPRLIGSQCRMTIVAWS